MCRVAPIYPPPHDLGGAEVVRALVVQGHAPDSRGRNQALRIPREFELPGDEVIIHKDGHRLIVEPLKKPNTLAELLASWEPLDEEFPEIEDPPVKPEDIF